MATLAITAATASPALNVDMSKSSASPPRSSLSLAPIRQSMEEYYYSRILRQPLSPTLTTVDSISTTPTTTTTDDLPSPPTYDHAVSGLPLPPSRFRIQPREDEGRETLPAYSCSIKIQSVFQRKMEMEGVSKAPERQWSRVFLQLQGTALSLYRVRKKGFWASAGAEEKKVREGRVKAEDVRGTLVKRYNLQHAEVGIAADYEKRRYVIRLRVEMDQFLLSCLEIDTFLLWLESLTAAIDLAPPLDERKIPSDTSLPRNTRRRRRVVAIAASEEAESVPATTPESPVDDSVATTTESQIQPAEDEDAITPIPVARGPSSVPASHTTRAHLLAASAISSAPTVPKRSSRFFTSSKPKPKPKTPSSEKHMWKPEHAWGPSYDVMYAKRCMAVLLCGSPRKTNLVVVKGCRWAVDWATGGMTRCDPPRYGEV